MSTEPDNEYWAVACPVCDAEAGEPCQGLLLSEQYAWGVHHGRVNRYWAWLAR